MPDDFLHQRTHINGCHAAFFGRDCECPPMRTYVAVDALLSDEAVEAFYAEWQRWPYRASTDRRHAVRAAIKAMLATASSEEREP